MEFISRYAELLTPNDVIKLFNLLEKILGSREAAAAACGLTRKTAYDWQSAKDVKFDTRIKLLTVLMEKLPEETLDHLTYRLVGNTSDILMAYLSAMYESIIDETEPASLIKKLELFDEIRTKYAGLIIGRYDLEVSDKIFQLKEKSKEFHLKWIPKATQMMTTEQACILIPIIISEIISSGDLDNKKIGDELNVPEELVKTIRFSIQQIPTLSGFLPYYLRRKLEEAKEALTAITNPPTPSIIQEPSKIVNTSASGTRLEGT